MRYFDFDVTFVLEFPFFKKQTDVINLIIYGVLQISTVKNSYIAVCPIFYIMTKSSDTRHIIYWVYNIHVYDEDEWMFNVIKTVEIKHWFKWNMTFVKITTTIFLKIVDTIFVMFTKEARILMSSLKSQYWLDIFLWLKIDLSIYSIYYIAFKYFLNKYDSFDVSVVFHKT